MFQATMSTNSTLSEEGGLPSFNPLLLQNTTLISSTQQQQLLPKKVKKKRNLPGNPDPDAEVIALSPKSLLATNRFLCEICNKGFQRDQNLQLHRRGHNLPWKLKQRSNKDVVRKKVYVCPEPSCVHHHPSRALGDLTGIKKHFCRKHGEKKYKCDKCSKIYAVQSDWKAHSKTCGTREYRCDCGTLFSRKDSFITHRAFCDALAEESSRLSTNPFSNLLGLPPPPPLAPPPAPPLQSFSNLFTSSQNPNSSLFPFSSPLPWEDQNPQNPQNPNLNPLLMQIKSENHHFSPPPFFQPPPFSTTSSHLFSATALLQKAATVGAVAPGFHELLMGPHDHHQQQQQQHHHHHQQQHQHNEDHYNTMLGLASLATWGKNNDGFTRDFLGLTAGDHCGDHDDGGGGGGGGGRSGSYEGEGDDDEMREMLKFTGGLHYGVTTGYDGDNSSSLLLKSLHHQSMLDHHHQHQNHEHEHEHEQVEGFGNFVGGESNDHETPRLSGSDSCVFLAKP